MLLDEIERTRAQLVSLRPLLTTRREESTSRIDHARNANALKRPPGSHDSGSSAWRGGQGRQPRTKVLRSSKQEPGPECRTGTSQGPPKAGSRSGSNRASVRMRVLLDRQRPRNYGAFGLAFPPGFPMAAHSLSYGFSLCRSIDLRPRPHFGLLLQSLKNLYAPRNPVPLSARHRHDFVKIHRTTLTRAR